jgi:NAD(P)-dependent dehydrogenase (short-subunit alcohol dehydrogenase family)
MSSASSPVSSQFLRLAGAFPGPVPTPKLDSTPVRVFVSGASRGIGFELTRQYAAANAKSVVIAGVRDPAAVKIAALAKEFSNVHIVKVDTDSDESIATAVKAVSAITNSIDILINNGQNNKHNTTQSSTDPPPYVARATMLHWWLTLLVLPFACSFQVGVTGTPTPASKTTRATLLSTFNTNVGGALVLTQSLLPLLHASKQSPRVVNISSGYGSTSYAGDVFAKAGAYYDLAYCLSKAALNNLTASFAAEEKDKVIFLSVCPGWVSTDMGGEYAPNKPADSAQGIRALIESKTLADSGKYLSTILGEEIPL